MTRNLEKYGINMSAAADYAEIVERHRVLVLEYGLGLGLDRAQLLKHDLSKFSKAEFGPSALYYCGAKYKLGPNPRVSTAYARALAHHYHVNPHHPEHWYLPGGSERISRGRVYEDLIPMPDEYVREMVTDWQAASIVYSQSPDMTAWLFKTLPTLRLHPDSRFVLRKTLIELDAKYEELFIPGSIHDLTEGPLLDWYIAHFIFGYQSLWVSPGIGRQYAYHPDDTIDDDRRFVPDACDSSTLRAIQGTMLNKYGYHMKVSKSGFLPGDTHFASFKKCGGGNIYTEYSSTAPSEGLAICRAALQAYFQSHD